MAVGRNDILKLSDELMNCVRNNDIIGARRLFSDISEIEDRKLIVAKNDYCYAPLFEAALRGTAEMVRFLVEECYANVEDRHYSVWYRARIQLVTPLWFAVASNKIEVVKCLIDLGADINATSPCGSTPVLFACDQSRQEVAEYLIRRGADINKSNKSGETCFMKAVEFKELCQLLIDNGADVKAKDENGDLALHYAIKRDQPDTVQLLLDHGSDPYVENKSGDDAFRTASIGGKELILKEHLFRMNPPVQRWIESCQLLGGYYVEFEYNTDKAMQCWKDAVEVQQRSLCVEIIPSKPNPVYLFAQEVNTLEELEALSRNRESVHMYALMIRERILGPNHDATIAGLLDLGKSYKQNGETRRCMDIWKHALQLQSSHAGQLTVCYFYNSYLLCTMLHNLYEKGRLSDHSVDRLILIKDLMEVLEMVTMKLELTPGNTHAGENFLDEADFMTLILLIIKFITEQDINFNAYQAGSFRHIVYRLVRCQPKTIRGRTLLHISILPSMFNHDKMLLTPSIAVVELLLECGANVNAVDDGHNTALHLFSEAIQQLEMQQQLQHRDLMMRIAELLLKNGAHVDMVNFSGDSAAEILTSSQIEWNVLDFVNLKCLAARDVLQYKIPYVGHIPASLESFVQMHSTPTADSDHSDALPL